MSPEAHYACDTNAGHRSQVRRSDLYNDRGDFYVKLGSLDEALSAYEKAISLNRDYALGHSNRGWVLAIKEEHADAITAYGEALRIVHFQVFVIMEL